MSKHIVSFTLTDSQTKKWEKILQSKDGIKTLTSHLSELKKLQKFKAECKEKKKKRKNSSEQQELSIPHDDAYKNHHLKQHEKQITEICNICRVIYEKFKFSGKEHHFQAALEAELRDMGYLVQEEVARLLHYKKSNGENIQLPHDIRGREDLLLPREKLILELKQTTKLTDKEFCQLCRYMQERNDNSTWGTDTRGMLINFGDNNLECWYLFYDKTNGRISRIKVAQYEHIPLDSLIDTYCL